MCAGLYICIAYIKRLYLFINLRKKYPAEQYIYADQNVRE